MASVQEPVASKKGDGTKELAILTGVLVAVVVGVVVTFWVGSRALDQSAIQTAPAVTSPVGAVITPAVAETKPRAVAPAPTDLQVFHADIYFDSNSARLRADAARVLQEKATLLDAESTWIVLVQGHADRYGTPEYNRVLAQRRADAVKQFMVELGVPESAVKVVAVGQDASICDGPSRECQKLNRRVHLEIRKLPAAALAPAPAQAMVPVPAEPVVPVAATAIAPLQPAIVEKDDTTVPSVASPVER